MNSAQSGDAPEMGCRVPGVIARGNGAGDAVNTPDVPPEVVGNGIGCVGVMAGDGHNKSGELADYNQCLVAGLPVVCCHWEVDEVHADSAENVGWNGGGQVPGGAFPVWVDAGLTCGACPSEGADFAVSLGMFVSPFVPGNFFFDSLMSVGVVDGFLEV